MASAKPDTELVYGQNDVPPTGHLILLSLQQGMLLILGTMLPVLLVKEIGGSTEMAIRMVSLTMLMYHYPSGAPALDRFWLSLSEHWWAFVSGIIPHCRYPRWFAADAGDAGFCRLW